MAIAKADLNALLNQAIVKMTGTSMNAVKAELFDVLTEFFEHSSAWLEKIKIDALAYQREYTLTPTEGRIIRLMEVSGNSNFSTNALYDAATAQQQEASGWIPQAAVYEDNSSEVVLIVPPNTPQAMHVWVAKNVTLPSGRDMVPVAPDWVLPRYHNYILDGILGKMMTTPDKSYSNDAMGTYHLKRFQDGIARARVSALKKNTYGASAWAFPGQFRTRSQRGYLSVGNSRGF